MSSPLVIYVPHNATWIPPEARAAANHGAHQTKLANLADNCDLSRIAHPSEQDLTRLEKYRQAIAAISVLNDG
jgi:hypothetical protein